RVVRSQHHQDFHHSPHVKRLGDHLSMGNLQDASVECRRWPRNIGVAALNITFESETAMANVRPIECPGRNCKVTEATTMKCPICPDAVLTLADRQGIEIDYCPQCRGVWLDRGELDKLLERSMSTPPRAAREGHESSDYRYQQQNRREPGYDHHGK